MADSGTVAKTFIGLASPHQHRAGAGGWPCQGIYYAPAGGQPRVALIATHYNVDFSEHYGRPTSPRAGSVSWAGTPASAARRTMFILEHALIDIGVGVRWLRERPASRAS